MFQCISPRDGSVFYEREYPSAAEVTEAVAAAKAAQREWRETPLETRKTICTALVADFVLHTERHEKELALQMGRPIRFGRGEVSGFQERATRMIELADAALADAPAPPKSGFERFMRRDPLGLVLVVAPWNYPYLTAVNSIIPALLAGNAVILKHSHQTATCAERLTESGWVAGLPEGLFQHLHLSRDQTAGFIREGFADGVVFTGSVAGGVDMENAAAGRFVSLGLELGGKDAAYVRADANITFAASNVADGAFFNSGQSCCGVERIYAHADIYDELVDAIVAEAKNLILGDPIDDATTLGPMVRVNAADFVRGQIDEAVHAGAKALVDEAAYPMSRPGSAYLAPQVLIGVDHSMRLMAHETFGPAVGIMKVASDEEAVAFMNDSDLGLTASIWSADTARALALGDQIQAGTVFLNRCDYLDPDLAWTGVKNSGRGISLSPLGFEQLTRVKSFHFRTDQG